MYIDGHLTAVVKKELKAEGSEEGWEKEHMTRWRHDEALMFCSAKASSTREIIWDSSAVMLSSSGNKNR